MGRRNPAQIYLKIANMKRWKTFTFWVHKEERLMIEILAEKLKRPQSDDVRFIVFSAARILNACDPSSSILEAENRISKANQDGVCNG